MSEGVKKCVAGSCVALGAGVAAGYKIADDAKDDYRRFVEKYLEAPMPKGDEALPTPNEQPKDTLASRFQRR